MISAPLFIAFCFGLLVGATLAACVAARMRNRPPEQRRHLVPWYTP
jgi:hypothetical protein